MATTTASRKAKGRRLQQYVRDVFRNIFQNKLEPDDIESRQMGGAGTDIVLTPSAKKLIPFDFEIKNQEKLNLTEALKQAHSNTKEGRIPALVFSRNHDKVYIALEFEKFVSLLYPESNKPHIHLIVDTVKEDEIIEKPLIIDKISL